MGFLLSPSLLVSTYLQHRFIGSLVSNINPLGLQAGSPGHWPPPSSPSGRQQLLVLVSLGAQRLVSAMLAGVWGPLRSGPWGTPFLLRKRFGLPPSLASESAKGVTNRHQPRDFNGAAV